MSMCQALISKVMILNRVYNNALFSKVKLQKILKKPATGKMSMTNVNFFKNILEIRCEQLGYSCIEYIFAIFHISHTHFYR